MERIQIAIGNGPYREALRDLLIRSGSWDVHCVEAPDETLSGVLVVDPEHLDQMPEPILNPERVVLVTPNEPEQLARAWEVGVSSVVFDRDPLSTAVLAVMSAVLRASKSRLGKATETRRD